MNTSITLSTIQQQILILLTNTKAMKQSDLAKACNVPNDEAFQKECDALRNNLQIKYVVGFPFAPDPTYEKVFVTVSIQLG